MNEAERRANLDADFDGVWKQRVETPEWLDGYAKTCPVQGAEPSDYRFVSELDSSDLVFGEIHDVNIPPLKTAARAGRKDVGGWVFIGSLA